MTKSLLTFEDVKLFIESCINECFSTVDLKRRITKQELMKKLRWNNYHYKKYSKYGIPKIYDGVRNLYDYDEVVEWLKDKV